MGISPRVGLIPTAVGGTSLAAWSPPYGTQWQQMVTAVQGAMDAAGPGARLRGMVWVQVRGMVWLNCCIYRVIGPHLPHSDQEIYLTISVMAI